jgi:endonuclease/exonuclease/phosphatase family metal-dependent hydrolase
MFQRVRKISRNLIFFINLLVAALFVIACHSYAFDPSKYWITGLLCLGAIYLLIGVLGFLAFWCLVKPSYAILSLAVLVYCWNPIQHLIGLRLSSEVPIQKDPNTLRVMSWNVEHFEVGRKDRVQERNAMITLINKYNPDVAFFQEMVGSDQHPKALNYIPFFRDTLGFKEYHFTYNNKLDFDDKHHFGVIIFSKYPLVKKMDISIAPFDYNSTFQYSDIKVGDDTIRAFNIHLQSLKLDKRNKEFLEQPEISGEESKQISINIIQKLKRGFELRAKQSIEIKKFVDKSEYPVIVCGDFNDVPNSFAYNTIGKNLQNAFYKKGSGIGRTFSSISPTLRIDHIFVSKEFEITNFMRIRKDLSDHYPLLTDLILKK